MLLVRIGKRYTFDAAHQLRHHKGKCANVHGHTYTVDVWVRGEQLTSTESWRSYKSYSENRSDVTMVIDYFDLDVIVKPIIEMLDHSFISAMKVEPIFDIADEFASTLPEMTDEMWSQFRGQVDKIVSSALGNVVELHIRRTTAEELAIWFWGRVARKLEPLKNIQLLGVVVSETSKTSAEFIAEVPHG